MAEEHADWSTESNDAVHISLVTNAVGGPRTLHSFNPAMTYSVFGDEERIFGYQGLKINLRYNACDMRPSLQIHYAKKFKQVGETGPTDLKAVLEPYLPKTAFEKSSTFDTAVADASYATWTPPGELWKTIQSGDHTYEVWKGSLADMAVQQMLKRIQILVPFFIEGGTFIELQDPEWSLERWTVFFLYEKKTVDLQPESSPYCFMGYSTVYRYFYFQPLTPDTRPSKKQRISHPANLEFELPFQEAYKFSSLPARSRISQFIILPPFQGGGNGSRFYNAIFDFYLAEPQTIEITVEDPNEAFDDLRDLNDLTRLRLLPEFTSIRINPDAAPRPKGPVPRDIVNIDLLETIRSKTKIAPRQFYRVVEMHLLSRIPKSVRQCLLLEQERKKGKDPLSIAKEHEYHLWTLWVKKRLYKHNKDMLMQLDRVERIEKMEQVVSGVEGDYARLLGILDDRTKAKETVEAGASSNGNANGKRRNPDDEADEEEADEPAAKKAKLAA